MATEELCSGGGPGNFMAAVDSQCDNAQQGKLKHHREAFNNEVEMPLLTVCRGMRDAMQGAKLRGQRKARTEVLKDDDSGGVSPNYGIWVCIEEERDRSRRRMRIREVYKWRLYHSGWVPARIGRRQ